MIRGKWDAEEEEFDGSFGIAGCFPGRGNAHLREPDMGKQVKLKELQESQCTSVHSLRYWHLG